jgi:hypothetical protein
MIVMKKVLMMEYIDIKYYIMSHPINKRIMNVPCNFDYNKKYDILLFGSYSPKSYPLRYRLFMLFMKLKNENHFKIKHLNFVNQSLLSTYISDSWLTISTCGFCDYFVEKYFEISACKSVIFGNMPDQGKKYYTENDYIHISSDYSDEKIINIFENYDKKLIENIDSEM